MKFILTRLAGAAWVLAGVFVPSQEFNMLLLLGAVFFLDLIWFAVGPVVLDLLGDN